MVSIALTGVLRGIFSLIGNSFEQSLPVGSIADLEAEADFTPTTENVKQAELEFVPVEA